MQTNQYYIFRLMIYVSKVSKLIIMCILTMQLIQTQQGYGQSTRTQAGRPTRTPNAKRRTITTTNGERTTNGRWEVSTKPHRTTPNLPAPPPLGLHSPRTHHEPPAPERRSEW